MGIESNVPKRNTSDNNCVGKLEGHDSINSFSESLKNSTERINFGKVLNGAKKLDLVNPNENMKKMEIKNWDEKKLHHFYLYFLKICD